jgi:hypothetical protein
MGHLFEKQNFACHMYILFTMQIATCPSKYISLLDEALGRKNNYLFFLLFLNTLHYRIGADRN